MKFALAFPLLVCAIDAFAPTRHATPARNPSTRLFAEGGAPKYDKCQASLREAEAVGDGSVMLHIDTEDAVDYEPGHVIALEINGDGAPKDVDAKTDEDAKKNAGWMRGPYTVSRSTENSIDILMKVVGDKSKLYASSEPGTPLRFGGRYKVPILEGISAETTDRVVFISSGVGVGPCVGAIEKALERSSFPPIDLIASYRTEAEIIYKDDLDKLQKEHPDKLSWKTIISSKQGRLSSSENLKELTNTSFDSSLGSTHYHLIGNGQMVAEFKEGLKKAGVPNDKITLEMYFNHKAEMGAEAVDRIAAAVMETVSASVA